MKLRARSCEAAYKNACRLKRVKAQITSHKWRENHAKAQMMWESA